MPTVEFNEKEYETAFNYEFLCKYASDINEFPYMPTTIKEANEGFDVNYKIKKGTTAKSLFFQFKGPRWYKNRPYSCDTSMLFGGNLLGFRLHRGKPPKYYEQHNCLVRKATGIEPGYKIEVYYVAPTFHTKGELFSSLKKKGSTEKVYWSRPSRHWSFTTKRSYTTYGILQS